MIAGTVTVTFPRVMERKDATALIGEMVADREPTPAPVPFLAVDEANDEPICAYLPMPRPMMGELRRAILATMGASYSAYRNGIRNESRTFGYSPRRPVYGREGCQASAMALENPGTEAVLDAQAVQLRDMIAELIPERIAADANTASIVQPDWRLGETHYTSGVVNRSAQLPYHRDSFNFPVWSAMPVLRRNMAGGYLHIPEYDITLPCRDGWVAFFPGQELVHGVTPMRQTADDGYRYSIVYYALKGMKDCFTAAMETSYARKRRTERERDMARRLEAGEPLAGPETGLPLGRNSGRFIGGKSGADFDPVRRDPTLSGKSGRDLDAVPNGDPAAVEDRYLEEAP